MDESLQSQLQEHGESLHRERRFRFRGTARVSLANLQFDTSDAEHEQFLRPKNVKRLRHIFATEGCHRLPPEHHVAALISQPVLNDSLRRSKTLRTALLHPADDEPPELAFPPSQPLQCLHGRHRIQAARGFLPPGDDWWVVDLYHDGKWDRFLEPSVLIRPLYRRKSRVQGSAARRIL